MSANLRLLQVDDVALADDRFNRNARQFWVSLGALIMSHTRTRWYAFTSGLLSLSTPTAHLSHQ